MFIEAPPSGTAGVDNLAQPALKIFQFAGNFFLGHVADLTTASVFGHLKTPYLAVLERDVVVGNRLDRLGIWIVEIPKLPCRMKRHGVANTIKSNAEMTSVCAADRSKLRFGLACVFDATAALRWNAVVPPDPFYAHFRSPKVSGPWSAGDSVDNIDL